VSVQWELVRAAHKQAFAGEHGPAAVYRLRAELERAHHLVERRLGELERPRQDFGATTA
jgi:hypothetical protein